MLLLPDYEERYGLAGWLIRQRGPVIKLDQRGKRYDDQDRLEWGERRTATSGELIELSRWRSNEQDDAQDVGTPLGDVVKGLTGWRGDRTAPSPNWIDPVDVAAL
jgi:hypothetical protein